MSLRVIDPNSTQKKKEEESTNAPLNPTVSGGAGSTASTSQAPTSQNQRPVNAAAPSSGSFTDLSKYKQAASTAGDRLSQGINRTISTNLNKGESSLNTAKKDFQSNVDKGSGYAATDEGRRQAIANVAGYTSSQSGLVPVPTNNLNQQTPQINNEFGEKDFSDVINKKYSGITSANQLESYAKAKQDASNVSNYNKLVEDRNKASDLMGRTFANRGDAYTQGMASLDSYLYNKSGAAGNVKAGQPFQNAANFQNTVSDTEKGMSGYVTDRTKQIEDMRNAARSEFSNVANQRTGQVEDRLNNVRNNWDNLTNMLRSNFIDPKTGEVLKTGAELDPLSMALMGVGSGSQLFNMLNDRSSLNNFIKSKDFERDRLIGSGEQQNLARLEALSRLANSPGMEYNNKYYDASRAGTLTASDALDRENITNKLNETMGKFKDDANKDVTTQGYANDRYRSGHKTREIHRYASATGSLDDVLSKAGYNYQQNLANPNISSSDIATVAQALNEYQKTGDTEKFNAMIGTDLKNSILPALTGGASLLLPGSSVPGKEIGREVWNTGTNFVNDLGNKLGILGDISGLDALGSAMGSLGRMFGSDKGSKIANAEALAQQRANQNLQTTLTKQLQDSGFYNTIKAGDLKDEKVKSKQQALIDLLSRLDSTNRGNY
jgi:hypothetical protein